MKARCLLIGVVILFATGMLTAPSDAKIDPRTIVGMWIFDEGSGRIAKDSSGNGNDGILVGKLKRVNGKFGKALEFPGVDDNFVEVPHNDSLTLKTFTFTAWVKLDSIADYQAIVIKTADGAAENYSGYLMDGSKVFWTRFTSGGAGKWGDQQFGRTVVADGNWHHVAGTYDMKSVKSYVDGALEAEAPFSCVPDPSPGPLNIGDCPNYPYFVKGIIDEVAIFNVALSEDDIRVIMSNGLESVVGASNKRILGISSKEASLGSQFTTQLNITDATGISSGDITLKYNPNILTVVDIKSTPLTSNMSLTPNTNVPGQIKIAMAGVSAISSGIGSLVDITFTVNLYASIGAETPLQLTDTKLYDELGNVIPIDLVDGTVKVKQACVKGDVNDDGNIKSNDATLILRIAAGLLEPNDYQKCAADVNGDGKIRSNDATIVLRKAAGLEAPAKDFIADRHINILLSETHGLKGETISVPITVDNADILSSGDMSISYDSKVLRAIGVLSNDSLLMAGNISQPGLIRISFAGVERLNNGKIAEINFEVLTDNVSPLTFKMAELYGTDALPLNSKFTNKQFRSWAVAPELSALLQNYPNPFNPETWIPYQLHEANEVVIRIHNVSGELVRELRLGYKSAGIYTSQDRSAYWDGRNEAGERVSSGVYFYNIQAGKYSSTMKMIVTK